MPAPSMTVRMRVSPGNAENGPSTATSARLSRQNGAPGAERATSCVTPPPFFHGWVRKLAGGMIRMQAASFHIAPLWHNQS